MGTPSATRGLAPQAWPQWLCAALISLGLGLIAWQAFGTADGRLPPATVLVVLVGPLATLLVGNAFGNLSFALSLGTLLGFWLVHTADVPAEQAFRANLITITSTVHLFVFTYSATFRRLRQRSLEQQQRIEQRLAERAQLTRAVSADLTHSVSRLGEALRSPALTPASLVPSQKLLDDVMDRARRTLDFRKEPNLEITSVLPDFRRRMTRLLFGVSVATVLLTLIRLSLLGRGPTVPTVLALLLYSSAWLGSELRPERRALFVGVLTVTAFIAVSSSFAYWGVREPPPNLLFLATLGYNAVLLGGSALAIFAVSGSSLAVQLSVAVLGVASTPRGVIMLCCTALVTIVLQACWYFLERRVLSIFEAARGRAAELERLDGFRARISGTLFHDVSNLVQVIGMTLQLAMARGRLGPHDVKTLRRFQERLEALVRAALEVLERGEFAAPDRFVSAALEPMFEELREMFQFRLQSKQQTLATCGGAQLEVLTVPELLRDSVLANLISNAIKFSPHGGTIALSAQREGGDARIVVRDQGPGFPSELIEKLSAGARVDSTLGTAGEQGLGLGLTLAAEHMRRIGGELSLRTAAEGGGEATLRLPASC
jgi:signal transduction histidine kinase